MHGSGAENGDLVRVLAGAVASQGDIPTIFNTATTLRATQLFAVCKASGTSPPPPPRCPNQTSEGAKQTHNDSSASTKNVGCAKGDFGFLCARGVLHISAEQSRPTVQKGSLIRVACFDVWQPKWKWVTLGILQHDLLLIQQPLTSFKFVGQQGCSVVGVSTLICTMQCNCSICMTGKPETEINTVEPNRTNRTV